MSAILETEPQGGALAQNIVHFARALRDAGVPLGPGAVLDSLTAVEAAGVGDRDDFYTVLHAVLVKKHEHSLLFEQVFRIFWKRKGLLEKLIAMLSPQAPGRSEPKPPRPGRAKSPTPCSSRPRTAPSRPRRSNSTPASQSRAPRSCDARISPR